MQSTSEILGMAFLLGNDALGQVQRSIRSCCTPENAKRCCLQRWWNGVVADSYFRVVFSVLHKKRAGHKHDDNVNDLLDNLQTALGNVTENARIAADRGNSKMRFWKEVLARGFQLVCVCSPNTQGDQPFSPSSRRDELKRKHEDVALMNADLGKAAPKPKWASDEFVLDDSPCMGPRIAAASLEMETSRRSPANNKKKLWTVAVRERGKGGVTSLVHITLSETDSVVQSCRDTFVMDPFTRNDCGVHKRVLFYPRDLQARVPEELESMEAKLLKHCRPLTALQRTADWFVMRLFLITGATGQQLALLDTDARKMILKHPDRSMALQGETADEFIRDFDPEVPLESAKAVFTKMRKSWHHEGKRSGTFDIASETIDEDCIFQSIKAQAWVDSIFEVGLVQSRRHRLLGVSADAVAMVRPPEDLTGDSILVSVEFNTRIAPGTLNEFGAYFSCKVGDDKWFTCIPCAHRGQLIHQACVLGTRDVLYVAASIEGIQFSCLVQVPDACKSTYEDALGKWAHLVDFAHDSLEHAVPPVGVPDSHKDFDECDLKVVLSHLPLWHTVRKSVMERGSPLKPVRQFRSFAQWLFSTLKGGVDGISENMAPLETTSMKMSCGRLLVERGISQVAHNAFMLQRLLRVQLTNDVTLRQVRRQCNDMGSFIDFLDALNWGLLEMATKERLAYFPAQPAALNRRTIPRRQNAFKRTLTDTELAVIRGGKLPKRGPRKHDFYTTGKGKDLRLSANSHTPVSLGQKRTSNSSPENPKFFSVQRLCVVCNKHTTKLCDTCNVPLHSTKAAPNADRPCWFFWHNCVDFGDWTTPPPSPLPPASAPNL
ncbi:YqaJ domain-containing protein [Durusdinium trenchii]|uniref:YqaJ domain-containing protein n=1 Tax=Durusdinium trenchii TaxID=1381693 RepID=A0ABP0HET5_9DINO